MACEDCLEVCLMGLVVVGRKYVWCLVIVVICMGFGQSHHLRVAMEVTKGDSFIGKAGSHSIILLYFET